MKQEIQNVALILLIMTLPLASLGCSSNDPNLATVTGQVNINGKPIKGARIVFQPPKPMSPSYGETDADGKYELRFNATKKGAHKAEHLIRIYTGGLRPQDDGTEKQMPELIADKYNSESTLKRTVKAGSNQIDFDLEPRKSKK